MIDITKHKWSDNSIDHIHVSSNKEYLCLELTPSIDGIDLNKDDAIAIAEHFGIIGMSYQRKVLLDTIEWIDEQRGGDMIIKKDIKALINMLIDDWFTL